MKTDETTETVLTADQENEQVQRIAAASLTNIRQNREKFEDIANQFTGLTIDGIDDKANYKTVSAGITATRTARTTVTKLVKAEKALLKKVADMLDDEGEQLIAIVSPIENALKAEKERIDTLKEEAEQELLRQEEEKKQARIAKLFELGAKHAGSFYRIGELTIMPLQVTQYTEAQWEGFIAQATVAYEAEQLRIAEEKEAEEKRLADEKKARDEAEESQRKAQELLAKDNAAKQAELEAANKERDEMLAERKANRISLLKQMGFAIGNSNELQFGSFIAGDNVLNCNKDVWDKHIDYLTTYITEFNAKLNLQEEVKLQKDLDPGPPMDFGEKPQPPKNGSTIKFTDEQRESILNDVLVTEEAVKREVHDPMEFEATLSFSEEKPFIDTMIGKSTLRIYVEQTLDAAQDGLTPEMVAASGSIGDELLYLVIKPR